MNVKVTHFRRLLSLLKFLVLLVLEPVWAGNGVWIMRMASHPYKYHLYTAEQLTGYSAERWCLDWLDAKSAVVLCRDVTRGRGTIYNEFFPPDFGDLMDMSSSTDDFMEKTFACQGTEKKLKHCPLIPANPRCPSKKVGFVDCSYEDNYRKNFSCTLVGSSLPNMGIPMLQSQNFPTIVGKVCDETKSWGVNEAKVTCRSLGYDVDHGAKVVYVRSGAPNYFPDTDPRLKYVIKDVRCGGGESTLSECHHREMCKAKDNRIDTSFMCADKCQGEDVGVICLW